MNHINFRHIPSSQCRLHKRYPERHVRIVPQHNKNSLKQKRHSYNFFITKPPFVVVYVVEGESIDIVRLFHQKRDLSEP